MCFGKLALRFFGILPPAKFWTLSEENGKFVFKILGGGQKIKVSIEKDDESRM